MSTDRELGMQRPISRRDFLQASAAAGVTAAVSGPARAQSGSYPPLQTGLRGSHEGSYEEAHALGREGRTDWGEIESAESDYDLIVIGAGISGLSAAYFYRQLKPDARILILDNHDDFGGHAKRNEFLVNGRRIIGYGGSQSLEAPSDYSDVARSLLRELTVDVNVFHEAFDQYFYSRHGLTGGVYFDKATYGREAWVPASILFNVPLLGFAPSKLSAAEALAAMPLGDEARNQLEHLLTIRADKLPDVPLTEVPGYLSSISYETFLTEHAGASSSQLRELLRRATTGYFGVGIDATPALETMLFGLPGLNKTGIPGAQWLAEKAADYLIEPYIFHFPDGNATIARLLARSLIPELTSERTAEALVQARFDYGELDAADHNVRIRLLSTAVNVKNTARGVEVVYRRGGRSYRAAGGKAVLACYNMMIPYLCPELPARQREALATLVKIPLVYSNVALTNWRALKQQQMGFAYTPSAFHSYCMMDFPVSLGGYDFARTPDDPVVLHFSEALIAPGLPPREQHRIGRARLLGTSFETIERDLRATLAGILGPAGFDPAADIAAITVNRWPHGYAYGYNPLFDPEYGPGEAPNEIGRRSYRNIAIANSDAGARAYLDEAIDQAHRAVGELLA